MASTLCNLRQCDGNGDGDKNFFFNNLLFIHNQIHFTPPAYDISSHIIHHQNDEKWKTQKDLSFLLELFVISLEFLPRPKNCFPFFLSFEGYSEKPMFLLLCIRCFTLLLPFIGSPLLDRVPKITRTKKKEKAGQQSNELPKYLMGTPSPFFPFYKKNRDFMSVPIYRS